MATILKGDRIGKSSTELHLVAFNVEDVQERARAYLAEIQKQAAQIVEDANKKALEISMAAHQTGLESGRVEFDVQVERRAQQISDQRCKTAIASCEATVQKLSSETTEWLTRWRNLTVELASQMAEKLVRRSMKDNEEILRVWLEEAIIAMRDARELRVLVHPDDFAVAGRFLQNLTKMIPQAAQIEVIPDPQVSLGGCIVRSMHGFIDQQLETQLQRLVEQLQ
jgi:flagellar biosynthesis/type III secretory pathway protein FliH